MVKILKNKKGWLRIVEAFIAILLVISVIIALINSNRSVYSPKEELNRVGKNVLDYLRNDEQLMNEALRKETTNINKSIEKLIPPTFGFSTNICNYEDACPNTNPEALKKYVYSNDILIPPNLTSGNPNTKLKLFLWVK